MTSEFLENVMDAGPLHLGDIRSPHSPVMMRLRIPVLSAKTELKPVQKVRVDWRKASLEEINHYTCYLNEKLSMINLPLSLSCSDVTCKDENHSKQRDSHTLDVIAAIV